jgi:hypothetical protein
MSKPTKIMLFIITTLSISLGCYFFSIYNFSEQQAFILLFGNYNTENKQAIWKNIPFSPEDYDEYFWTNKQGIVKSVLFEPYIEQGSKKIFLLTYTKTTDISYDCHACPPLLSAFIFVKKHLWSTWTLEAENRILMYSDEYGTPPEAKLIKIGNDKYGLLLEHTYHAGCVVQEISIVAPYKDKIFTAHSETTSKDNFNDCGKFLFCTALTATWQLIPNPDSPFYTLKIKRLGTVNDENHGNKIYPISEEIYYKFFKGKYVAVNRMSMTDHFR